MRLLPAILVAALAGPAAALTLDFPATARQTAERAAGPAEAHLPVSPWRDGAVETRGFTGEITQTAWQVGAGALTTLQLMAPLREQIEAAGYSVLFECEADACGGFDFRFDLDLLPEPDMHVDLADYRYLMATRPRGEGREAGTEAIALVASRSSGAGFVQRTLVTPRQAGARVIASSRADPARTADRQSPGERLENEGHAALDDLRFTTGSADLDATSYASLEALARWLRDNPEARVVLVGHTDATGTLDTNIALSRRRADAVRERLIGQHAVSAGQIDAEGIGYLAPRVANRSDEGRTRNRRVEAVLITTQ